MLCAYQPYKYTKSVFDLLIEEARTIMYAKTEL